MELRSSSKPKTSQSRMLYVNEIVCTTDTNKIVAKRTFTTDTTDISNSSILPPNESIRTAAINVENQKSNRKVFNNTPVKECVGSLL